MSNFPNTHALRSPLPSAKSVRSLPMSMALAVFVVSACTKGTVTDKTNENDGLIIFFCDNGTCTDFEVHVLGSDLAECFGWDETTGWPPGTPDEIIESDCADDPESGPDWPWCHFDIDGSDTDAPGTPSETVGDELVCGCVADTGVERSGADCCDYDYTVPDSDFVDALAACDPEITYFFPEPNCDGDITEAPCDSTDVAAAPPNADIHLYIDDTESYITITTPTDSITVDVTGSGAASVQPDYFLTAVMWPDPGTLDGTYYSDWLFWFSTPVEMDLSGGTYTVDDSTSPLFRGSGLADSAVSNLWFSMGEDAGGVINNNTYTWDLDYTETMLGKSVTLHLEGTFYLL